MFEYIPYVTTQYYRETFNGLTCDDDKTLKKYIEMASQKIDALTFNRIIQQGELDDFPDYVQFYIKQAVCSHVETLVRYGNSDEELQNTESFSLGKFSITAGNNQNANSEESSVSRRTMEFLKHTGLLTRSFNSLI